MAGTDTEITATTATATATTATATIAMAAMAVATMADMAKAVAATTDDALGSGSTLGLPDPFTHAWVGGLSAHPMLGLLPSEARGHELPECSIGGGRDQQPIKGHESHLAEQ